MRRLAWPFKRKWYVIVRIVVRSTVSVGVSSGPCGGVFRDSSSNYIASGRDVKIGRCNCMIYRGNRCRSGKVRTVGDHGVATKRCEKYNGEALA
jgi:hypothetical protein